MRKNTQVFNGIHGKNGVLVPKLVEEAMKLELEVFNILEPLYHLAKNVRDKRIGNVIVNHVQVSDFKNIFRLS